jgi:repressor of nif and glnA expression
MEFEVSSRTVRHYLNELSTIGYIKKNGKKGYTITDKGYTYLRAVTVTRKVGLLSSKIHQISHAMTFDLKKKSGTVAVNITIVDPKDIQTYVSQIKEVYKKGYAMGTLIGVFAENTTVGQLKVPKGKLAIATVCSITLNGVLLSQGIPVNSRFGGLLMLQRAKPIGFVEMIMYDGTSIDPLEVFIRSGMTNYIGAITDGSGRIGASFREFPSESSGVVKSISKKLDRCGLGSLFLLGRPSQPLLQIPVNDGSVGAVIIGGLNPMSIFEENGVRVQSRALSTLIDYTCLNDYRDIEKIIANLV